MSSSSLTALEDGLSEVRDLQRANPRPPSGLTSGVAIARAIGRASVVILCSHLEGYVDSVNVEAASTVNSARIESQELPQLLRLLHSRHPLETIAGTSWEGASRANHLAGFMGTDAWLWTSGASGALDPDRLLTWMSTPTPKYLARYFRYWGVDDIFDRITRAQHTRQELWIRLQELVDKRNSIAHGDLATAATSADVRSYLAAVERFASRVDRVLAKQLAKLCGVAVPW